MPNKKIEKYIENKEHIFFETEVKGVRTVLAYYRNSKELRIKVGGITWEIVENVPESQLNELETYIDKMEMAVDKYLEYLKAHNLFKKWGK